jgi:hypothetical protein
VQKNIVVIWEKNVGTCQKIIKRIVEMIRNDDVQRRFGERH